jgi:hypothetical protein
MWRLIIASLVSSLTIVTALKVMEPSMVEGQSVLNCNLVQINGASVNGYNATLKLKMLDVQNNTGPAIKAVATGQDQAGIYAQGHSNGHGILALSAGGAGVGSGLFVQGNDNGGDGANFQGRGIGTGAQFNSLGSGPGAFFHGAAGASGVGIYGGTNGPGLDILGSFGGGDAIGMFVRGGGTGTGLVVKGGDSGGSGLHAEGRGAGQGIVAYSTGSHGAMVSSFGGNGTGLALNGHNGNAAMMLNWQPMFAH